MIFYEVQSYDKSHIPKRKNSYFFMHKKGDFEKICYVAY